MSIEWGFPTVWELLKETINLIKRPVKYAMSSKSFADHLREDVQNLENKAERVHRTAEEARNNLRILCREFTDWDASAKNSLKEARDLLGDYENATKTCCYGTLPDLTYRYGFSRKAEDKSDVIKRLAQECSGFREANDISCINPPPGYVAPPSPARREGKDAVHFQSTTVTASVVSTSTSIKLRDAGVFESRALIIGKIMDALANNSNRVVGVYGMGGVGKSTLLEDVKRILSEKKSFDWVAKADVSENPDIKRIQGELADALGLTSIKDKETISGRAELLHRRLKEEAKNNKKVLIILDNLWKGLDLKSVGIPCGHDNKVMDCKLLLTSRDQNVLQRDMGCDSDFFLEALREEEARDLFERMAGDKVCDEGFKPLVDKALDICAGFPFLIIAIGKYFKNSSFSMCKDTLKQIDMPTNKGIGKVINEMLQLSYDRLQGEEGEDARSLLQLCVASGFSTPSLEYLVRYGVGLRLFQEDSSMEEARDRLNSLIHTLQASSLLLDDEDTDGFKVHDLVRRFVTSLVSTKYPLLVWKDEDKSVTELSKDNLKRFKSMCFPYVDLLELPEKLDCPELQMFMLLRNDESFEISDSYFNSTRNLMVLDLDGIRLTRSSSPFQSLENLHTLCLDYSSLEDVAVLGKLNGLQILSITNSSIHRLPKEIEQLTELRLLDLSDCSQLEIIDPGVLGSLTKLEELYMENSFGRWNALDQTPPTNASLIELKNMKNLYTLHVSILDPSVLPHDLNIKKLTKYKIKIGDVQRSESCKGSSTLELKLDPIGNILQNKCIQSILGKTDELFLDGFDGIEQSICALSSEGFPKLKHLHVKNSPSVHYILQSSSCTDFKTLESLHLENLINLEKICNNNISSKSFGALKEVRVKSCDKMEIMFPLSSVRELPQLEKMEIVKCKLMRGIVENDDCGKFELRKMHALKLCDLPDIKNFMTVGATSSNNILDNPVGTQIGFFNGQQVSMPSLESLTMEGLPNLKKIWSDESQLGLSNLQSLNVLRCESLSKVINFWSLIKLHKLHNLTVKDCVSVQEIFDLDGPSDGENVETLFELTTLELIELPSLRYILSKNSCGLVSFHNLEKLKVNKCDNLEYIFFPSMVKSLVKLRDLTISNCKKMETAIIEEEGLAMETLETLTFSMLTNLWLEELENFTCFSSGTCSREVRNQDRVQSRFATHFNGEVAFPRLEALEISSLDNLEFLFTPSMVKSLTQLKKLNISFCGKMKTIIMEDEGLGMAMSETLAFPMLTDLKLYQLGCLTGFSRGKCSQEAQNQDHAQSCSIGLFHGEVAFPRLEALEIRSLDNLEFMFTPSMVKSLTQLKKLNISSCEKMETIIMEEEGLGMATSETLAFPMLTDLKLSWLRCLKGFSCGKCSQEAQNQDYTQSCSIELFHGEVAFPRLEALEIKSLDNLEFMFTPSMVKSLTQLKKLQISSCEKMETIIMEEEGLGMATSETLAFPMLIDLKLSWLRCLKGFSCGKCSQEAQNPDDVQSCTIGLFHGEVAFPNLETLHIVGMDNIEKIWDNQVSADFFHSLKSLYVDRCNWLMNLVPACILMSLESLEAKDCGSLEVVFELQPLNPPNRYPVACFPLKKLKLSRLPELKCVWDNEFHRQDKFHCLRSISVSGCRSLTSLVPASAAKDLVELEELMIEECGIVELIEKEEGLVPKIVFPKLSSLELKDLTELTCIYNGTHALFWPALKTLEIQGCDRVKIFASQPENEMTDNKQSLFLIEKGTFPNLEKLKLDLADQMEIWNGHFYDEEFFCKLRVLELHSLSKESPISICCFVESLTKLEEFVVCEYHLEEPSSNEEAIGGTSHELKVMLPFSGYARHLQSLVVSHYEGLSIMFTLTAAENLVALKKLSVSNCKTLTEVISAREGEKGRVVAFNKLEYMKLDGLIELRCFSSDGYTLMFPVLEDVVLNECPKMKFFSEGLIEAPKLERLQVDLKESYGPEKFEYFWKGNINITIRNMFEEMVTIAGAKSMWLSDFPKLIKRWHDKLNPIKSSWQLESLVVNKCPSFINAIPSKLMLVLEKMKNLQVCDCELLEEIFDLEKLEAVESTRVLPQLSELNLVNLPRLRQLWNKDLQGMINFSSLYSLNLYKCSNLRHAFVPSMARCLANLQSMEIKECGQMEGVIGKEEGQGGVTENITFPKLRDIKLECLPNLTSFLSGNSHTLDCPKMKNLTIARCPKIRSLTQESSVEIDPGTLSLFTPQVQFPQLAWMKLSQMDNLSKIWTDDPQEALIFNCLSGVKVQNCRNLENLFPHWVARSLTQLRNLWVESCEVEEIVASGDDAPHSDAAQVLFPELISLILHEMPRLKSFCPNMSTWSWPLLEDLRVTHCDKMNMPSFAASMNKWTQKNEQRDLLDQEAQSSFERDFSNLKRLCLVEEDVQMLQDGKFPNDIFGKIEALTLACFHDGNVILPPRFLLERFQNLKSLEVLCSSFEDIFPDEGLVDEEKHLVLENLTELKLSNLHNLKRVWREDNSMEKILQRIETFEVEDCPDLTIIFPSMMSFRNLTRLVVKNSSRLIHLVTTSTISNLPHLTSMIIIGCEKMHEVVTDDGNEEGKVISLGKLEWLTLQNLPSLVCFSSGTSCNFRFPSLLRITVEECPQMKFFCKGTLSTPELRFGSLFGYKWQREWKSELNTIIKKISA